MRPIYYRQSRTPSSEQYQIMDGAEALGHLDLHYTADEVYGTLVLERELSEDEILELREHIDDDLVESADVPREDFVLRVYAGREVGLGLYSDAISDDELPSDGHGGDWE